jgi:hypothetical protein
MLLWVRSYRLDVLDPVSSLCSCNRLNPDSCEGVTAIARALRHVPQLQELDFLCVLATTRPACGVRPHLTCLPAHARRLLPPACSDFDCETMGDVGCKALAKGLRHVPQLKTLYLPCAQLTATARSVSGVWRRDISSRP